MSFQNESNESVEDVISNTTKKLYTAPIYRPFDSPVYIVLMLIFAFISALGILLLWE